MKQLPLDLKPPRRPARGRGDFILSASNEAAVKLIDGWRGWPDGRLSLSGPEGAGKTHLALVWMALSGAEKAAARALAPADAPALVAAGAVVVEDADRAMGEAEAERALFHLLNLARAEGASVLLTGRAPAARWPAVTPDLASRLASFAAARIEPPDDQLLERLIAKHFADRDLRVGDDVVRFLARRVDRSAAAAAEAVARLDQAALASGGRPTLRLARDVFAL